MSEVHRKERESDRRRDSVAAYGRMSRFPGGAVCGGSPGGEVCLASQLAPGSPSLLPAH